MQQPHQESELKRPFFGPSYSLLPDINEMHNSLASNQQNMGSLTEYKWIGPS